jgi:carbon storage regulator
MLILARRIGESIMIGDQVEISVVDIKGDQVKLGIKAPPQVKVYRREVYAAIQAENRAAASVPATLPILAELLGTEGRSGAGTSAPGTEGKGAGTEGKGAGTEGKAPPAAPKPSPEPDKP